MNLKDKIKNYGFWMSITAAVILLLQTLGDVFGFIINDQVITNIVSSVCGVLVVLGIISNPTNGNGFMDREEPVEPKE